MLPLQRPLSRRPEQICLMSPEECAAISAEHPEPGYFSDQTEAVKKAVSRPVALAGGIRTPEQAEQFLEEEKADLIGIGRLSLSPGVDFSGWF